MATAGHLPRSNEKQRISSERVPKLHGQTGSDAQAKACGDYCTAWRTAGFLDAAPNVCESVDVLVARAQHQVHKEAGHVDAARQQKHDGPANGLRKTRATSSSGTSPRTRSLHAA